MNEHDWPQDLLSEQTVIGAAIAMPGRARDLCAILKPSDFYRVEHRKIWAIVAGCVKRDWQPDLLRVTDVLSEKGVFARGPVTAGSYLAECVDRVQPGIHPAEYAESVRECSIRRNMIVAAEKIVTAAQSEAALADCAVEARTVLRAALEREESGITTQPIGEAACEWFDEIEAREHDRDAKPAGVVPTRIAHLDRYLRGGFRHGHLVVIAARTSHGKSTLALQAVCGAARSGHPTAFFSLEMPRAELLEKIACAEWNLSASDLDDKPLSGETFRILGETCGGVERWPMQLLVPTQSARLTVPRIIAKSSELAVKPELVVIDNLGQIDCERDKGETDAHAIGRVTTALKAYAMQQGVCVVLCAQINRAAEARANKEPELADLRDSGSIEADADVVILLSLPGNYLGKEISERTTLEQCIVKVAKQRMGRTGKVGRVTWNPTKVRFQCLVEGEGQ